MSCGRCAAKTSSPLPGPSSSWVDPELALQDIDPKRYPEFPNHFAIGVEPLRAHLLGIIAERREHKDALTKQVGATRTADERTKEAQGVAARNAWWANYGVWVGIGGTLLVEAIALGAVLVLTR